MAFLSPVVRLRSNPSRVVPRACAQSPTPAVPSVDPGEDVAPPPEPPNARPCGWVRRASLTSGRAVKARTGAQAVEWSVPENEEVPCCELERLAWAVDAAVENQREVLPFAMLQGRVRAMPRARGSALQEILRNGDRARLAVEMSADIPRVKEGLAEDVVIIAREIVTLPYQIFTVRQAGADAFVMQAAVWPVDDLGYQAKLAAVLGMAPVVEVHSEEQLEAVLKLKPKVSALLLCNRDLNSLAGNARSFGELYKPFKEDIVNWGIPVMAEAEPEISIAEAESLCKGADMVLCDVPSIV